ncbi:P-loop containing nucleoside triphosphate hydrolase protein [Tothia fuscella]|uniref:P-loop containing nucleoside triphosphate hydrolase protein n=1 Tax=Tothia fuscella TaxID=1048955 RepID=A0A9P4NM43_9PEZI|nr:P-loop containing nucleoside triphosphate hydrolase protein [Tothia fuscella]
MKVALRSQCISLLFRRSPTASSLLCRGHIQTHLQSQAPIFIHCANQILSIPRFYTAVSRVQPLQIKDDTIFALSTASGRAAIAVIRISGPACVEIYHALCPNKPLPKARYATVRTLYDPSQSATRVAVLDSNALILYFPSPKTVTGEDILELHVHGGPAIVKAVLQAVSNCSSPSSPVRYAEAGEFTRRAFLNNRLDLTQVEALGDTLSATTEQQRKLSVRGTTGRLAKRYEKWRTELLYARGELEALIDFSEDQHFDESPAVLASSVATQVQDLRDHIKHHITNATRGELLRNGISIALLGPPNAGKSSLLNLIVGREAAIVSREAGTTRDVVEVGIDLGGYLCRVGDMAGLRANRSGADKAKLIGLVEEEGIKRAVARALDSDVVILVFAPHVKEDGSVQMELSTEVLETAKACVERGSKILAVINKIDLLPWGLEPYFSKTVEFIQAEIGSQEEIPAFAVSCKPTNGNSAPNGLQPFLTGLISTFETMTAASSPSGSADPSVWQESLGASERHRELLEKCLEQLDMFLGQVRIDESLSEEDLDVVVAAESLRAAAECLARITGRGDAGDVEEVLGVVFEKFCVGK